MLIHLGYVSTQTRHLSAEEQVVLLKNAQEKNAQREITGMLIHRDDSFFQVIEGEQDMIHRLYAEIKQDARHQRVEKLFEEEIAQREFPNWSMTMRELDDDLLKLMPEFAEAQPEDLNTETLFRELPKVRQLLRAFQALP